MPRIVAIAAVCLATCTACLTGLVVAQEETPTLPADAQPSVYVKDSSVAVERLTLAARLERQKEWDKAADVYLDIATKFADRLIPSKQNERGQPTQYVSAARVVQERLATWPAEGLAAYRYRFEGAARDLFNAGDAAATARLSTMYFLTDAGRDAALRDIAAAFERGDFATSASIGHRLLDTHPGISAERPRVLLQTGLAEHLAGRDADARQRLAELKTKFPNALARAGGSDAKAIDILEQQLATFEPPAASFKSDDWPSPFGNTAADAVPAQVSLGGAKLFSIELTPPRPKGMSGDQFRYFQKFTADSRRLGTLTGVLPVIDGGAAFFSDNARVYAIDLGSGSPLPGWAQTYAGDKRGAFALDAMATPASRQSTVSVVGDRVVAMLGQYNPTSPNAAGFTATATQIVCLDRATGRQNWSASPIKIRLPESLVNLRDGTFYGSPVVDGDTVYVLVAANRGQQFDECYAVALNLSDGSFKWATYVASASLGDPDMGGDPMSTTPAAASLAGGRLYVLTNLGALACLDATDGHTEWLNIYNRNVSNAANFRNRMVPSRFVPDKPFEFAPPVVSDGRVFVVPYDSKSIYVYDAADGTPVREIPRQLDARFPAVRTLVGVVGDALVLANRGTIFRLPWKTFDPNKSVIENGGLYKHITREEGDDSEPPDAIRGRPFLSTKSILVTTNERLYRISLDTFKIDAVYPAQGKWDADESAGNIVVTPENLVIAGPGRVTVYADLAVATAKLDTRLAADPTDVDASLRYADLLLAAGQPKPALARLDDAATHLGGLAALTPGPMRDRLFESALGYATKLRRNETDTAVVAQLFDRAAAAASSPVQQVRYRVSRAALLHEANDVAGEIALHQQILARPDWRNVPAAGKGVPSSAGAEAEAAVAELVRQGGRGVYASYETAAAEALAKANATNPPDPDALLAIADEYPVSTLTPDLLTTAADRFEAGHQPRRATQTLRRLLKRDLSNERRQVALQSLARNHLAVPYQAAIAQVRLRQAKGFAPDAKLTTPLVLPDGKPLTATTVAEAMTQIDAYRADAQSRLLPRLGLATAGDITKPALKPAVVVAAASAIVEQQADLVRNDRVVVYGLDHHIGVISGDNDAVRWTEAAPADNPVGCGFVGETLVVVAGPDVWAVNGDGKLLWKTALAALPSLDVTARGPVAEVASKDDDGIPPQGQIFNNARVPFNRRLLGRRVGRILMPIEPPDTDAAVLGAERVTLFRLLSDRLVIGTSSGRVVAVDLSNGAPAWQTRVSDLTVGRLQSNDDFVAVSYSDSPAGSSVFVFDAVTGQTLLTRTYDGNSAPQSGALVNLALSPDGVLVTMLSGRLIGMDLYDIGSGDWKHEAARPKSGEVPFITSAGDGQLVIAGDRVLALYRSSGGAQSVKAYSLRTLKPITTPDPRSGQPSEIAYGPRGNDPDGNPLLIAASGANFYIFGPRSLAAYNLDHPDFGWAASPGAGRGPTRDVALAQDFVLQINQLANANLAAQTLPAIQLAMFSRAPAPSGSESGVLEQRVTVKDLSTILASEWQVADGAFYYVSGDQKVKVLRVNR